MNFSAFKVHVHQFIVTFEVCFFRLALWIIDHIVVCMCIVQLQKIPILFPRKVTGNSRGDGGFKKPNFVRNFNFNQNWSFLGPVEGVGGGERGEGGKGGGGKGGKNLA